MFVKKPLPFALAAMLCASAPVLASDEASDLKEALHRLMERVAQLEAANQQLAASMAQSAPARDIASRLDDIEKEVVVLRKPSALEDALEGVSAGASLVMVAQSMQGNGDDAQLNARADVEVELPMGQIGEAEGRLFAHFRAGDGEGVDAGAFATSNSTVFGDINTPVLMQAWYQLDMPVGGASGHLGRVEMTVGKIDPFGFFDGNNVADDESEQFLNLAFIHNPLLDAGGDIGVGEHGASPGLRLAYVSDVNGGNNLTASFGVFGAGEGADYLDSFSRPMLMGQVEYAGKTFGGLAGAYRLYGWSNGNASNLAEDATERHTGWGVSLDQQVASHITLFSRIGFSTRGEVNFDQAYTLGAQFDGGLWGRESDRIGLAAGWLKPSDEYKAAESVSGTERPVELYYAWQVNEQIQLSPSVQWIHAPGGDDAADDLTVWSLRAKASF